MNKLIAKSFSLEWDNYMEECPAIDVDKLITAKFAETKYTVRNFYDSLEFNLFIVKDNKLVASEYELTNKNLLVFAHQCDEKQLDKILNAWLATEDDDDWSFLVEIVLDLDEEICGWNMPLMPFEDCDGLMSVVDNDVDHVFSYAWDWFCANVKLNDAKLSSC